MKNKKILFGFFAITIALISGCNKQATSDVEIFLPIESTINISTEAPTDTTTTPSDEATNVITNSTEDIRSEENTGESSSKTEQSTEDIPVIAPVEPANVSLIAVGDMLLHGGIHTSSQQSDGSYDYTHVFEHVIDRIAAADIAVANQEVILGGAELGISSYPNFNAPYDFGNYLVKTGFDVILHASNHTMDKDTIGVLNTMSFWKQNHPDITVLGINENQEERDMVKIVEKNGIKIAMLNYTYGLNGYELPEGKPYLINLMNESTKEDIKKDLQKARETSDFVIVYPHWGTEYVLEETSEQQQWAQFYADNGADLIIGTHPHVVEPVKWITAADGRQVLVYYSLGNFISIQYYNYSMLGGMAKIDIRKDEKGTYIADYGMDFLVTHYTGGRTEMTTYFLEDYTEDLAGRHAIHVEPYTAADGKYAEGYRNINQWYPFTVDGLNSLAKQICPDLYQKNTD